MGCKIIHSVADDQNQNQKKIELIDLKSISNSLVKKKIFQNPSIVHFRSHRRRCGVKLKNPKPKAWQQDIQFAS